MKNPKISIIVPIYNAEKYIDRCMDSIFNQTFADYEIILVNDGSKDNSLSICKEYEKKDNRIKVIDKENGGAGSARNAGIDIAKGEYLYFIDSDDEISSNLLERTFFVAKEDDFDLIVFSIKNDIIDSNTGSVLSSYCSKQSDLEFKSRGDFRKNFSKLYYEGILFGGPVNKLFRTQIIKGNGVRFPDLRRGQDEIFNFRYYRYVNSLKIIPDVLYTYFAFDKIAQNKKYRINYFEETTLVYYKTIKDLLNEFGLNDEYSLKKFQNSFIYSLESAFLLAWNPLEKLDKKDKMRFIEKVLSVDFIKMTIGEIKYIPEGYEKFWSMVIKGNIKGLYGKIALQELKDKIKIILKK